MTLYLGDFREVLPGIPRCDAVITDPPYGDTSLTWDRWPTGWPSLMLAAAPAMWCFGSMRMFLDRAGEFAGWKFSQDVVWRKQNGSGLHNDRFRRVHEAAALFYQGKWSAVHHAKPLVKVVESGRNWDIRRGGKPAHFGDVSGRSGYRYAGVRLMPSVIEVRNCHKQAVHPTQKPLGIIAPLLEYSVPSGGCVLDPFAGSGTTLLAAKMSGRRAIGIERDERYCEAAARRLDAVML